ncbi:hypothetical protein HYE66_08135 [Aggregatibacter actinomycetemcomitans]|nr:hypothetical protein [Aggregatibacter actinomycetemcomitans]
MQEWLENALKGNHGEMYSLINNAEAFDSMYKSHYQNKVLDSFYNSLLSLHETEVISANKNISHKKGESLKPDLVLFSYTTESLVLVELKNSSNATREAGTEFGAYNYELYSYFPNIPKLDIVHIIISNEYPDLLLHHIRNMVFIQNLNVLCLMPVKLNGELKLEIIDFNLINEAGVFHPNQTKGKIPASFLQSFQICIYDDELQKGGNDFNRLDKHVNLFKTALNNMANIGNKLNSNGFAILWKDRWSESLAPYSISVVYMPSYEQMRFTDYNYEIYESLKTAIDEFPPVFGNSIRAIANEVNKIICFDDSCSISYEGFVDFRTWVNDDPFRYNYLSFVSWGDLFRDYHMQILHEISTENENWMNENNAYIACEFIDFCIDTEN